IICNRTLTVNGYSNRPQAKHTKSHQTKSEDRRINHDLDQTKTRDIISPDNKEYETQANPKNAEVTSYQSGENVQGRSAFPGSFHYFAYMGGFGTGEDLGEFRY